MTSLNIWFSRRIGLRDRQGKTIPLSQASFGTLLFLIFVFPFDKFLEKYFHVLEMWVVNVRR